MIKVTLEFPDIAAAAEFLASQGRPVLSQADAAADKAGAPRPDNSSKPAKAAKAETAKPAAPAPAPSAPAADAVDYPTLQKAVFTLAAKNKDRVMALIAEQGGKSFKELAPEQWADALARVQAATKELEAEVA